MPLAYLEYDPWQRDRGSLRVRIPPVRRASRSITRDTRSSSVPSLFIQKPDRKRTIERAIDYTRSTRLRSETSSCLRCLCSAELSLFIYISLFIYLYIFIFGAEIFLDIKSRLEV